MMVYELLLSVIAWPIASRRHSETGLPRAVVQQHAARRAGCVLSSVEIASQDGSNTKCAKESVADSNALYRLCPFWGRKQIAVRSPCLKRGEGLILLFPVEVIEVREIAERAMGRVLVNANQSCLDSHRAAA